MATNIHVQGFECIYVFISLGYTIRAELLARMVTPYFIFWGPIRLFAKEAALFFHSPEMHEGPNFPHDCLLIVCTFYYYYSHHREHKTVARHSSNLQIPIANDAECLFMSQLKKWLLRPFAILKLSYMPFIVLFKSYFTFWMLAQSCVFTSLG